MDEKKQRELNQELINSLNEYRKPTGFGPLLNELETEILEYNPEKTRGQKNDTKE